VVSAEQRKRPPLGRVSPWSTLPVSLRAIIVGILVGLIAANVWPILLRSVGVPLAAIVEVLFLTLYLWWVSGGGPPRSTQGTRRRAFRSSTLSRAQWIWGLIAALSFAATIHAAIVLLFRFVPFPAEAFRYGYDLSFIPSPLLRWLAVVLSATSAGICEETGFRGYMQQPIEQRHGALIGILVSSLFFVLVHLTKAWSMSGMIPIVFGAGVLLGVLAWSSQSLIPSIVGHVIMDIGLFAYWWTGIAGNFTLRPISETGIDQPFIITCVILAIALVIVLVGISRLRRIRVSTGNAI
jgi:membrane protease YdiL (CAAX protease family)